MTGGAWEGEVQSSQDLLALIEVGNKCLADRVDVERDVVSFSGDVVGLYPALDKHQCGLEAGEVAARNHHKVKGVNYQAAILYLTSTCSQEELQKAGLSNMIPSRRSNKGTRPGEHTPELDRRGKTTCLDMPKEPRIALPEGSL